MGICKRTTIVAALTLVSAPAKASDDLYHELECLAKNIYFESRDQPLIGKVAVGQVTLNRVKSDKFPNTICKVVEQKRTSRSCQFSWFCDGKSDKPTDEVQWKLARETAMLVHSNFMFDVTEGSLWYHADYILRPRWTRKLREKVKINEHIFYATK